jgi:hypothetical protein
VIALRDARRSTPPQPGPIAHRLVGYRGGADFVYFMLTVDEFLLVPVSKLSLYGATFSDDGSSRYQPFKNSFESCS